MLRPDDAQKALCRFTGHAPGSPRCCSGVCSRADGLFPNMSRANLANQKRLLPHPNLEPMGQGVSQLGHPTVSSPWCSFHPYMPVPSISRTRGPENPDSMVTSNFQGIWVEELRSQADQGQSDFEQVAESLPASASSSVSRDGPRELLRRVS